jgi:hypothetical protein
MTTCVTQMTILCISFSIPLLHSDMCKKAIFINHTYNIIIVYVEGINLLCDIIILLLRDVQVPKEVQQSGFAIANMPYNSNVGRSLT